MSKQTFVIVGASLAGASAAEALRKEGFDGRIVLVGEEERLPYERPDLSKKYLRGEPDAHVDVHEPGYYGEAGIELVLGRRVDRIDLARRAVVAGPHVIPFEKLLLATGTSPRTLAVPGADLDGVLTLRTVDDADTIRKRALEAESIVVVGGGWIGSEVAASLRQLGREVTLVLPGQVPLERVLGREVGEVYRAAHAAHGVSIVAGTRVVSFGGQTRVDEVRTEDGRTIAADFVVVGVGAEPRVELAAAAGLAERDGLLVDECLATSAPGVFAAGDVANAVHPRYGQRIRVEHWDNAKRQGRAAAANMLGRAEPYERTPYFYSDQYDIGMEYTGHVQAWDQVVLRGDPRDGAFIAFWLHRGRIAAGMNVNVWDVAPAIRALVESGVAVDPRQLSDPACPLGELAPAA